MRYILDHDLHIHSRLSPCSNDPEQNPEAILARGVKSGLRHIVLTDHFWDEDVPCAAHTWAGYEHIKQSLPLPQAEGITFHFGCEADMDRYSVFGLDRKNADRYGFIVAPLNHLHLPFVVVQRDNFDNKEQANILAQRFLVLTKLDLPFHKVGLAHITWRGLAGVGGDWENHIEILNYIPDARWRLLFSRAAELGMGIELNTSAVDQYEDPGDREAMLRPYRIAKECGCKFYFGSDAHHPADFENYAEKADIYIDALSLTEEDKFRPFG